MHQHTLSVRKMVSLALLAAGLSACNNGDDGLLGGPTTPENTAPQALNVAVWGQITAPEAARSNVKTTLQLTGDYFDAESDVADTHEFRWKKNGVVIEGANSSKLVLVGETELVDAEFIGCVTPIAKTGVRRGLEVCAPASNDNSPSVPIGTPVPAAQPKITGTPAVGLVIKSRYNYVPNGTVAGSAEGGSKFGWLIYRDPSLPTLVSCQANAEIDCEYTVDTADKDKTIYSCVQPRNQLGVWGAVRCDNTNANNNVAPELRNSVIWGAVQNGVTLTASAQYFDQDGDQADSDAIVKSIRWLRRGADGNETQVATGSATYQVTGAVEGAVFKACATPHSIVPSDKPYVVKSGIEVCTTTSVGNPDNPEQPPVVLPPNSPTPLATPTISGTPLQGRTIQAIYSYDANVQQGQDGSQSGEDPANSRFAWLVEDASGLFKLQQPICNAGAGTPCDLTVTNAMVGKKLKACVLPANQLGAYGPIACTDTLGSGVTLSGKLVYGEVLNAHVVGLSGTATWKVDTNDNNGFVGDVDSPTAVFGHPQQTFVDGETLSYRIGLLDYLQSHGMIDVNGNGVLDDYDWLSNQNDAVKSTIPSVNGDTLAAQNYIGKDVKLCVTSDSIMEELCVSASEASLNDNGEPCASESGCVVGGLPDVTGWDSVTLPDQTTPIPIEALRLTGRYGVNMQSTVQVGNFIFHRALGIGEYLQYTQSGRKLPTPWFVNGVLDATGSIPTIPIEDELNIYRGYLAAYPTLSTDLVDFCDALPGGPWRVTVAGELQDMPNKPGTANTLIPDINSQDNIPGSNAILDDAASFGATWSMVLGNGSAIEQRHSALFGWPMGRFGTATAAKGDPNSAILVYSYSTSPDFDAKNYWIQSSDITKNTIINQHYCVKSIN